MPLTITIESDNGGNKTLLTQQLAKLFREIGVRVDITQGKEDTFKIPSDADLKCLSCSLRRGGEVGEIEEEEGALTVEQLFSNLPEGWTICFQKLNEEQAEPEKGYMVGDAYLIIVNPKTEEYGIDCKPKEVVEQTKTLLSRALSRWCVGAEK